MAANTRLVDNHKFVWGMPPKNYSSVAGTEKYISLKNYNHCTIHIITGAWAAGTAAVTINQATDVSATSAKALAFSKQFTNQTNTSSDTLVETTVTSNTFNLNTANTLYVIEVDAATLDVDGGFDCLSVEIASPGANADLYAVLYELSGARFRQANPPSAIVD